MSGFINRSGNNINKKILNVNEVTRDESGEISILKVTEIRDDLPVVTGGTPLNADSMNSIINDMINSKISSNNDDLLLAFNELVNQRIYECLHSFFTDEEIVTIDYNKLALPSEVFRSFALPKRGLGSPIIWSASGSGIIVNNYNAVVSRTNTNQVATLTATLSCGNYTTTKAFNVTVLAIEYDTSYTNYDTHVFSVFPDGSSSGISNYSIPNLNGPIYSVVLNNYTECFDVNVFLNTNNVVVQVWGKNEPLGGIASLSFVLRLEKECDGKTIYELHGTVNILDSYEPED